uniref:Transmembrane protein n=1 Tax=Timema genevievae TaxID=629358 RepID=A0A7R9JML0_TIMGE|nr:unnamed protein product [Timema genevievae]
MSLFLNPLNVLLTALNALNVLLTPINPQSVFPIPLNTLSVLLTALNTLNVLLTALNTLNVLLTALNTMNVLLTALNTLNVLLTALNTLKGKASGGRAALWLRARLQAYLFQLGCFLHSHAGKVLFVAILVLATFCVGLKSAQVHTRVDQLWVQVRIRMWTHRMHSDMNMAAKFALYGCLV